MALFSPSVLLFIFVRTLVGAKLDSVVCPVAGRIFPDPRSCKATVGILATFAPRLKVTGVGPATLRTTHDARRSCPCKLGIVINYCTKQAVSGDSWEIISVWQLGAITRR